MEALDVAIPQLWRKLPAATEVADFPVRQILYNQYRRVPPTTGLAYDRPDLCLIWVCLTGSSFRSASMKDYDTGWGGIIHRFDVRRRVEEDLMFKVLLENETPAGPLVFILIRSKRGSFILTSRLCINFQLKLERAPYPVFLELNLRITKSVFSNR